MKSLKKWGLLPALLLFHSLHADTPFGIMGGGQGTTGSPTVPIAYLISSSGTLTSLSSQLATSGFFESVAINSSGMGILGGRNNTGGPIGYLVSPTGVVTPLSSLPASGSILSVSISDSGAGIIAGDSIASLVSPSGTLTSLIPQLPAGSSIDAVAMNSSGTAMIGGRILGSNPIAYFVSPSGALTTISPLPASQGTVFHVAINNSGAGILAGQGAVKPAAPFAFLVSPSGATTDISTGIVGAVAINDLGNGIIGGVTGISPFANLVSSTGTQTPLSLSPTGSIDSVAINNSGAGLIGGTDGTAPIAYLFSPTGVVTPLSLLETNGTIYSVAINQFDAGLIGGVDLLASAPIAYLVAPDGTLTKLSLSETSGFILQVALSSLASALSQIPTAGLTGNNLTLANYINSNAPNTAFYFVPSVADGTLPQALESVAPTRNAFSVFAADNNLFFLNHSFSRHSQDVRQFRRATSGASTQNVALLERGDLLAANADSTIAKAMRQEQEAAEQKERPYEIWGEAIGVVAYQKAQHQTPGFEPVTGGIILAFDAKATTHGKFGVGAAYAFTHLHERHDAGHSNINQEYFFLYALWDNSRFYFDGAVWGGLFQTENVRKIHMTGFNFQTKSHPKGWQLAPHAEFGYDKEWSRLTLEPFVMLDWISNWQWRYKESGRDPFNFRQKDHYSSFLRSELGLRFYETVSFDAWRLGFKEKASYVNKKPFKVGTVTAALVGAPGSFTVDTLTTTQNLGVAEMELIFEPVDPDYPYGTIDYQGEFGSKYQSHQVSLSICWNF